MALLNNPNASAMPSDEILVLSLISEELKSRKFFNTLIDLGLDNSWYQPHLDDLIMKCIGLSAEHNETLDFFFNTLNTHAANISASSESVQAEARAVYQKLVARASGS